MDPVKGDSYSYPNGYVSYFKSYNQTVHPTTGRTISPRDPMWHWSWTR